MSESEATPSHSSEWSLPLLPGEVGPAALLERTEVFERIEFSPCEQSEAQPRRYVGWTKAQLYAQAKTLQISGRSRMNAAELREALQAYAWAAR